MCQFGDTSKILEVIVIPESEALVGYRNFVGRNGALKAINNNYVWPSGKPAEGNPAVDNNEGVYNYNSRDSYYNCNHDYNNDYYYNHDYDNDYYYNYNYYIHNYSRNYNYVGKTLLWGKVIKYALGYRSKYSRVTHLVDITYEIGMDEAFVKKFNTRLLRTAKKYGAILIHWKEF